MSMWTNFFISTWRVNEDLNKTWFVNHFVFDKSHKTDHNGSWSTKIGHYVIFCRIRPVKTRKSKILIRAFCFLFRCETRSSQVSYERKIILNIIRNVQGPNFFVTEFWDLHLLVQPLPSGRGSVIWYRNYDSWTRLSVKSLLSVQRIR